MSFKLECPKCGTTIETDSFDLVKCPNCHKQPPSAPSVETEGEKIVANIELGEQKMKPSTTQGAVSRETIEDILLKTGKHNQEQCSELADAILRDLPSRQQVHAVWVKASERLPEKDGLYCFRANGGYMGAYVTTDKNGRTRWVRDSGGYTIRNWKQIEWLDESESTTPSKEGGIEFTRWVAINLRWVGPCNHWLDSAGKIYSDEQLYQLFKKKN